MDLFLLLIRLVGFAVTFYLLLEFVVVCNVPTTTAALLALGTALLVLFGFILLKRYNVIRCSSCKQHMPRSMFGRQISTIKI